MRSVRIFFALVVTLFSTGCGYVHFGRLPTPVAGPGDAALAAAYTNLATEHKILKQELALVRREGDSLRNALDRSGGAAGLPVAADLTARLNETSRELAALRASYAKLQSERGSAPADPATANLARTELEEKLATSLRNYTQLQEENSRLRTEVSRTREENLSLADQLKAAALQAERTQSIVAQLNTDLIAQKEARARAEQAADAVRTQLSTVMAHGNTGLQTAKAPPADSSSTVELRVNTEQLLTTGAPDAAGATRRIHVVQAGDTLEKIATKYYGAPERWRSLYDANRGQLGNGEPIRIGMELQVPELPASKSN